MTAFLNDTIFGVKISTWLIIAGCVLFVLGVLYLIFFKKANAWIKKHKEVVLYVVFGGLTTLVNYLVFYPLVNIPGMQDNVSWWTLVVNVIAWVAAVAFAYVTNKFFVFQSKDKSGKTVFREIVSFVGARVASLLIEEAILALFVTVLHFNENLIKLIASIGTVIINYFFSKFVIFRKKKTKEEPEKDTKEE
ncbi:MAG: GtrA family protein [Clostridia bacterium]|nr:GtrA family protein [Clostridia bacterium]